MVIPYLVGAILQFRCCLVQRLNPRVHDRSIYLGQSLRESITVRAYQDDDLVQMNFSCLLNDQSKAVALVSRVLRRTTLPQWCSAAILKGLSMARSGD